MTCQSASEHSRTPKGATKIPAQRPQNNEVNNRHTEIKIFTDGSCTNNGKENARCGGGVWFGQDDPRNKAVRVPGELQSNQIGELAAVIIALQEIPHLRPVEIVPTPKYTINGLTTHLRNWEDIGWIGIQNAALFKKAAFLMKRRSAKTTFSWVKAHRGTLGNKESDKLAKEGAEKDRPDTLDLQIPPEFDLQGSKDTDDQPKDSLQRQPREIYQDPVRPDATEYIQATKNAIEESIQLAKPPLQSEKALESHQPAQEYNNFPIQVNPQDLYDQSTSAIGRTGFPTKTDVRHLQQSRHL